MSPKLVVERVMRTLLIGLLATLSALLIAFGSTIATAVQLLAYTPIVMTGTFTSRPDGAYVQMAMDDFILPSRGADRPPATPDYTTPVRLDTPEQAWPITGLFDDTFARSVQIGWDDLQQQIATTTDQTGGEPIIVFGYSQSAVISIKEKRRLTAQYPVGSPDAPDIQFVLIGDLNRPNGGVMTRFQGGYLPFVDFLFDGPAPTDTEFETVDIARQYDGFADFPLYPINLLADLNALLGILYVHTDYEAVSLDPTSPLYVAGTVTQQYGDTTYYTIPTARLPLLQPLRDLGVPEPLMALVEPALRVVIETGYDRSLNPGVPAPARLIPRIDPVTFGRDFVAALQQGVADAHDEIVNPTPRPAGPTPTQQVVGDLVRTNLTHTRDRLSETGVSNDTDRRPAGRVPDTDDDEAVAGVDEADEEDTDGAAVTDEPETVDDEGIDATTDADAEAEDAADADADPTAASDESESTDTDEAPARTDADAQD